MTKDLLFRSIFFNDEKFWKYCKQLFKWFVDLEKVYNRLSSFGRFCRRMALMVTSSVPLSHSVVPTGILWQGKW